METKETPELYQGIVIYFDKEKLGTKLYHPNEETKYLYDVERRIINTPSGKDGFVVGSEWGNEPLSKNCMEDVGIFLKDVLLSYLGENENIKNIPVIHFS